MSSDDKRPFIMCEYAYAKSNSNGNFAEFWELVRKYPRFQGGFLWDFHDKALVQPQPDGSLPFRYAGASGRTWPTLCRTCASTALCSPIWRRSPPPRR